jgi:hypothetical protein
VLCQRFIDEKTKLTNLRRATIACVSIGCCSSLKEVGRLEKTPSYFFYLQKEEVRKKHASSSSSSD